LTETRLYLCGHRWRVLARPLAALAYCALALLALAAWLLNNPTLIGVLMYLAACTGAWAAIATAAAGLDRPPQPGRYGRAVDWMASLGRFAAAVLVVLAVGTAVAAAGAQPGYLLGVQGLADHRWPLVVPVAAVAVTALALLRVDRAAPARASILDPRLRWAAIAGVTVLAAALVVWLLRVGDPHPAAGLLGHDRLGDALYVAPRLIELLVGYPALILALRWPGASGRYLLLVLAALGTARTIDTFVHFDLPYWTAVLSSGYGMAGGLVIGVAVAVLLPVGTSWLVRRQEPPAGTDEATVSSGKTAVAGNPAPSVSAVTSDDAVLPGR
jgi:hypothetical protein